MSDEIFDLFLRFAPMVMISFYGIITILALYDIIHSFRAYRTKDKKELLMIEKSLDSCWIFFLCNAFLLWWLRDWVKDSERKTRIIEEFHPLFNESAGLLFIFSFLIILIFKLEILKPLIDILDLDEIKIIMKNKGCSYFDFRYFGDPNNRIKNYLFKNEKDEVFIVKSFNRAEDGVVKELNLIKEEKLTIMDKDGSFK